MHAAGLRHEKNEESFVPRPPAKRDKMSYGDEKVVSWRNDIIIQNFNNLLSKTTYNYK